MALSQPQFTIIGLGGDGVHLLSSNAPEFTQALSPARAKEADGLLTYAVLLKNDTDADILGWAVRWACRGTDGKMVYHNAERDIAAELAVEPMSGSVRDTLIGKRDRAFERMPQSLHSLVELTQEANRTRGYEECYVLVQGYLAGQLLEKREREGEEATLQSVKKFTSSKRYPNVHR